MQHKCNRKLIGKKGKNILSTRLLVQAATATKATQALNPATENALRCSSARKAGTKKPFVIKGCTSDVVFTRRSCDNKCYDEKKTFGGIEHYTCVHCCTGDKCNSANSAGFHMRSGIILTFASTTLALKKYLYF